MKINFMLVTRSGPGQQLHSQSSPGDLAVIEGQRNGYLKLIQSEELSLVRMIS